MGTVEVDRAGIERTYKVIGPHLRRTPVLELSPGVTLKLEYLQHSGSFKARGAMANLLLREVPAAGVVAASGGNHGAAVAWAAQERGVPARIYVPTISSPAKLARIRGYGAELVVVGERYADSLAASQEWAATSDALPVHAFDAPETLLGAGSAGLELSEQAELDTVLVSVGGGGLIGGTAAAYTGSVRIVGVEPTGAPTLTAALAAGGPADAQADSIAADSLAPRQVGRLMFPIAQAYVDRVLLVTDEEIVAAQRALWEVARVVAEPGGATAFAALHGGRYRPAPGERVGVIVSGANTTAVTF
jgi:threonine dehydratase